uniref:Uncharacterized protein n=1 Tax=Graphocephala atropunctata TaxID=36148 RepID=A0A1B6KLN1_9HEMI
MFGGLCSWRSTLLLICLQTSLGLGDDVNQTISAISAAAASSSRNVFDVSREQPNSPSDDDSEQDVKKPTITDFGKQIQKNNMDRSTTTDNTNKNAIREVYQLEGKPSMTLIENGMEKQPPSNAKVIHSQQEISYAHTDVRPPQSFSSQFQEDFLRNRQVGLDKQNQDSSVEILQQILQSNGDDLHLQSKPIPIENAYLTKVITYNITKSSGNNENHFRVEKKYNYSTNLNYYDSRDRLSNYSAEHSSTLQKILGGGHAKERGNKISSKSVPKHDFQPVESIPDHETLKPTLSTSVAMSKLENKQHRPSQFIGGQFAEEVEDGKSDLLGQARFGGDNQPYSDFVEGQFIKSTDGKGKVSHISNIDSSEFVGGQYIAKQPEEKEMGPTYFLGGQFIGGGQGIDNENLGQYNVLLNNHTDKENKTYVDILSVLGDQPVPFAVNETEISKPIAEITNSTTQQTEPRERSFDPNIKKIVEKDHFPVISFDSKIKKGVATPPVIETYAQNETFNNTNTQSEELEQIISNSINGSSEGSSENIGIFKEDPETGKFVTEIVGNGEMTQDDTEGINKTTNLEEQNDNEISTKTSEIEDELEGEPSNLQPTNVIHDTNISLNSTSNEENVLKNSLYSSEELSLNSNTSTEHDVELYGGNIEEYNEKEYVLGNITTETKVVPRTNESYPLDIGNSEAQSSMELCFPITNKKRDFSLLDIISGKLFLERGGMKIPIYLKDNPMKNCTSGTENCKLYVDFKKPPQPLQLPDYKKIDNELLKDSQNSQIQVNKRAVGSITSEYRIKRSTEKHDLISKIKTDQNQNQDTNFLEQIFSDALTKESLKQNPELRHERNELQDSDRHNLDESPVRFNLQLLPNKIVKGDHNTNMPLNIENEEHILSSNFKSKKITLHNMDSFESSTDDFYRRQNPLKWPKTSQRKRPARTIHSSRSQNRLASEADCDCSSTMLKSALPTPSYTHFVNKRRDILTNIVHAVKNWAIGTQ